MLILGCGGHPTIRRTNDRMGMPQTAEMGGKRTFAADCTNGSYADQADLGCGIPKVRFLGIAQLLRDEPLSATN